MGLPFSCPIRLEFFFTVFEIFRESCGSFGHKIRISQRLGFFSFLTFAFCVEMGWSCNLPFLNYHLHLAKTHNILSPPLWFIAVLEPLSSKAGPSAFSLPSGVSLFICLTSGASYLIPTLLETSAFCGVLKLISSLYKLTVCWRASAF